MNILNRSWGEFLSRFEWNVFMTIHYYSKFSINSSRRVMTKIFETNKNLVNHMFYVSEFNSDFKGVHSHSLLCVSDTEKFKKTIQGLRGISNVYLGVGEDLIRTKDGKMNVGYYVSKFMDQDLDYEFLKN